MREIQENWYFLFYRFLTRNQKSWYLWIPLFYIFTYSYNWHLWFIRRRHKRLDAEHLFLWQWRLELWQKKRLQTLRRPFPCLTLMAMVSGCEKGEKKRHFPAPSWFASFDATPASVLPFSCWTDGLCDNARVHGIRHTMTYTLLKHCWSCSVSPSYRKHWTWRTQASHEKAWAESDRGGTGRND